MLQAAGSVLQSFWGLFGLLNGAADGDFQQSDLFVDGVYCFPLHSQGEQQGEAMRLRVSGGLQWAIFTSTVWRAQNALLWVSATSCFTDAPC